MCLNMQVSKTRDAEPSQALGLLLGRLGGKSGRGGGSPGNPRWLLPWPPGTQARAGVERDGGQSLPAPLCPEQGPVWGRRSGLWGWPVLGGDLRPRPGV